MADMTLLEILWHSLGMTKKNYRKGLPWWNDHDAPHRNHFAADPQGTDAKDIDTLVNLGLMFRGQKIPGGLVYFHVSPDGIVLAKSRFAKAMKQQKEGVAT